MVGLLHRCLSLAQFSNRGLGSVSLRRQGLLRRPFSALGLGFGSIQPSTQLGRIGLSLSLCDSGRFQLASETFPVNFSPVCTRFLPISPAALIFDGLLRLIRTRFC